MSGRVAHLLKQSAFDSPEQEIVLAIGLAAARIFEPWELFLKDTAGLTQNQYNVLRILRGSAPHRLPCGEISARMVNRDPDITRLVERLARRGLVTRSRSRQDRRVVEIGITDKGQDLLRTLDEHVRRFPKDVIGHLGPKRLQQLRTLLEQLMADLGTYPGQPSGTTNRKS
jgi:DNA-binding MarR family transcriptional regulator